MQEKLEDNLCSTPVPEIVINIEKLFQDVTENDAVNKSMEISSQEWVFPYRPKIFSKQQNPSWIIQP